MNNGPICVTGASGFIGAQIVAALLDKGYQVRGTVRSLSEPGKYDFLTSLPGADERLELVEGQLLTEGSYDDAVFGCTAVFHVASPYFLDVEDPQRDLVDPAVEGTLNVLRSCAKANSVQRVVLTSSVTAISDEPVEGKVFSEKDWNEKSTLTRNPYYLSKVKAEKAAWEFAEDKDIGFDLVVINPSLVIGPSLSPTLSTSNGTLRELLGGGIPALFNLDYNLVDVRDVAQAHILALENPKASGRYLCFNEAMSMEEIVDLLKREGYGGYPLPKMNLCSPLGNGLTKILAYAQPQGTRSFLHTHVGKVMLYDNSKIQQELGLTFIPVEQSVLDTVSDLLQWGHLEPLSV